MGLEFKCSDEKCSNEHRVQVPLSTKLAAENRDFLDLLRKFKENNVPRSMILGFLQYLLVPKINYGAVVDEEEEAGNYKEIEKEIM